MNRDGYRLAKSRIACKESGRRYDNVFEDLSLDGLKSRLRLSRRCEKQTPSEIFVHRVLETCFNIVISSRQAS